MIPKDARTISYNLGYRAKFANGPLKVILVMITAWSFFFSAIGIDTNAWAAKTPGELTSVGSDRGDGLGLSGEVHKEINPDTLTVPDYLGTIRDAWTPGKYALASSKDILAKPPHKMVIHIQDAHCNYDGQHKISEILAYVNKEYGVKSVNLEGGAKNYNLSPLTSITEAEIRQRVTDYFVKNGRVNGAEYFAVNNPGRINLWGIEDTQLYVANLGVYRASLQYKREVDKYLSSLSYILTNLKVKIYNKELLEFDAKYIQYKAGNLEFKDYLSYILAKAREKGFDIKEFASLHMLSKALDEEPGIDFGKANSERDQFVEKLQKKLSNRTLEELIAKTGDFKSGRVSQKDFYDYLAEKAKVVNVDPEGYLELKKYIDYISTYSSVDKMKVMGEIAELESKLKETMYESQTQRKLDLLSKNLVLLKNIFNISLSKDDYKYFVANKASFDMGNYVDFIEKEAPSHRIATKLEDGISKVDAYRDDIAKFYEYSLKRDEVFLKNMKYDKLSGKTSDGKEVAIMITGGFHTENLAEHFRRNNIAYVSIMPNFRNNEGYKAPYMDLLAGQETQVEKAIDAALSSMQIYDYLTELGVAVDGERGMRRWLLSVDIITALERGQDYIIQTPLERIRFYKDKETGEVKYAVERRKKDDARPYNAVVNNMDDIGPLLYETHQDVIDKQLTEAYRNGRTAKAAVGDVEAVAEFFANKDGLNRPDIADMLLTLHSEGRVNIIKGVKGFKGHAGAQGIHISEDADIRATIAHEAMAYFYDLGHDVNDRVEQAYLAYAANPKNPKYPIGASPESLRVDLADARPSPIAKRTEEERTRLGRDNAAPGTASVTLTPPMRPVYNELDLLLQGTNLWRDNLGNTEKLYGLQKQLRAAVFELYLSAKSSIPTALINDPAAIKVTAYIVAARNGSQNIIEIAQPLAKTFEEFCKRNNLDLQAALEMLYPDTSRFKTATDSGIFNNISIDGFSQSLFTPPNGGIKYLSVISGLIEEYGIENVRTAIGTPNNSDQFRWLVINPSFRNRLNVDGVSLLADDKLLGAAGATRISQITPKEMPILATRTAPPVKYDEKMVNLVRNSLEARNTLISNNGVALLALGSDGKPIDLTSLETILRSLEAMVMSYIKLIDNASSLNRKDFRNFNGIDFKTERIAVLEKWQRLKTYFDKNRGNLSSDEVQSMIIQLRETPSDINMVTTLHEFINFLHGRVMYPIFLITSSPLRQDAFADQIILNERNARFSKTIDVINIDNMPFISNGGISSQPLNDLLMAYAMDQNPETKTQVILNNGMIFGNINIGVHRMEFEYAPHDPDSDGGIKIQYMEYSSYQHNLIRLKFIEEVMRQLGIIGKGETAINGRYLTITVNKNTGAKSAEDIRNKFIAITKCLLYTQGLEFAIPASALDTENGKMVQAARLFIEQQKIHPSDFFDLEPDQPLPDEEDDEYDRLPRRETLIPIALKPNSRKAINARLEELGIGIPVIDRTTGKPPLLTQRIVNEYVNEPLERRIDRGELIWQNGILIKNKFYSPVNRLLKDAATGHINKLVNTSEALAPILSRIDFENVGIVGRYLVQVGVFKDGVETYLVTATVNPDTGNIILAQITKRNQDRFEQLAWSNIEALVKRTANEIPKLHKINADEEGLYLNGLKSEWRRAPLGITNIPCKRASPGEQIFETKITMDKDTSLKGGYALLTKHTTPEDFEYMAKSEAVITTSGGALSHAGIVCSRELKKPSVILSNAIHVTLPEGQSAWEMISYEPETGTREKIEGFEVFGVKRVATQLSEGSRVIIDGTRGRLFLVSPEAKESSVQKLISHTKKQSQPIPFQALVPKSFEQNEALEGQPVTLFKKLSAGDWPVAGPKNANLGELQHLTANVLKTAGEKYGFSVQVPDGFSVNTTFFSDMLGSISVIDKVSGNMVPLKEAVSIIINSDTIMTNEKESIIAGYLEQVKASTEAAVLSEKIDEALKQMGEDTTNLFWAVRSSSIDEDSDAASFAGMGNTYLFIPTSMLLHRIIDNYSSIATGRSLEYRAARVEGGKAFSLGDIKHATGIQVMVTAPDAAGVIFTKNPSNDNDNEIMINASYGLGEPVVNGSVDPDSYVVDKYTGTMKEDRYFGHKLTKVVAKTDGFGTITLPMVEGRYRSAFGENWRHVILMLTQVSREIETHYGRAMDIEFAIKGNTLYLLQARPITTGIEIKPEGAPTASTPSETPPRGPDRSSELTPPDKSYLAALDEKGKVSAETAGILSEAGPIYDAIASAVPIILDTVNRDATTYLISPAPVADYAKTVEWANKLRQALGRKGAFVQAGYYKIGMGEDWMKGLESEFKKVFDGFLDKVLKDGQNTARLCIRVPDKAGRDSIMKLITSNARFQGLSDNEQKLIMSRIKIENIEIIDAVHLNPVPDLFTDMLAMEFDRFEQNDYLKSAMPENLPIQLGRMLQLTTSNITPEMTDKDNLANTLKNIFDGLSSLVIRPIDWKSIDEWRDRNNAVAIAA